MQGDSCEEDGDGAILKVVFDSCGDASGSMEVDNSKRWPLHELRAASYPICWNCMSLARAPCSSSLLGVCFGWAVSWLEYLIVGFVI